MPVHATLSPTTLVRRTQQSNDSEYLTAAQVMTRYGGVSHMWLLRRMAKDHFPKPIYFGRLRFWRRTEIESWECSKAQRAFSYGPIDTIMNLQTSSPYRMRLRFDRRHGLGTEWRKRVARCITRNLHQAGERLAHFQNQKNGTSNR